MTTQLCYLPAHEAIRLFESGGASPVELMREVLQRAEQLTGSVNATSAIHAQTALAAAHVAESRYRSGTQRVLEGVPVAIKEETSVAGWRRTIGSLLWDEVPTAHHPMVDKLLAAGAIPHIQTTVPEFCVLGQTLSRRFGVTRNPWNLALTPGGSSGGAGAALSAGMTPLATGSDMGGSIRIPAALGGLYGFKPPFGRLASAPGEELFAFAVEGPMTRDFSDLVLMQNVVAGPHPATYSGMPYQALPSVYPDLDGTRIAVAFLSGRQNLCADTRRNIERACAVLEQRGARIEPVELSWDLGRCGAVLIEAIFGLFFDEYLQKFPTAALSQATPYLRWLMQRYCGKRNSIMQAAVLALELHQDLQYKLWDRGVTALICPTVLTTTIAADLDVTQQRSVDIEGGAVDSYLGWVATTPFNLLSRYPALAVPTGMAASGIPTSMQIVAPPFGDAAAFRVAYHHAAGADLALFRSVFPACC